MPRKPGKVRVGNMALKSLYDAVVKYLDDEWARGEVSALREGLLKHNDVTDFEVWVFRHVCEKFKESAYDHLPPINGERTAGRVRQAIAAWNRKRMQ